MNKTSGIIFAGIIIVALIFSASILFMDKIFGAYVRIIDGFTEPKLPSVVLYVVAAVDTEGVYDPNLLYYTSMTKPEWRESMKDSFGSPVDITWYVHMSTATCDPSPNDTNNCLREYDTMMKYANVLKKYNDSLEWHYHHCKRTLTGCSQEGYFNDSNRWKAEKVLNMMLIERDFFPSSYRAGWEWEDNGLSNFLEGVTFSDYSNDPYKWFGAPREWSWYHPSPNNYQQKGNMSRYIHECTISQESQVVRAFERVATGNNTIFCWWTHSWNSGWDYNFKSMHNLLVKKSDEYGINFKYVNGREAMRLIINKTDKVPPKFTIGLSGNSLLISSSEELFNGNPYGAIKLANGSYMRAYLTQTSPTKWNYDITSLSGTNFIFAVGGADKAGNTNTAKFNYSA